MKKIMLLCLGLMLGMASISHATPLYDSNANKGKEAPVISSASASRNFTLDEKVSARFNRLDWFNDALDGGLHDFFSSIAIRLGQDPVKNHGPAPEPGTMLLLGSGLVGLAYLTQKGIKGRMS